MRTFILIYLLLTFSGPLILAFISNIDFHADWRTANRESAHIAPDPATTKEAVIQVYSARTFSWRGLFAVHTWLVIKPADATQYTVYDSIGWRYYQNMSPVAIMQNIPDRYWFNQKPQIILDIRGDKATQLISAIQEAAAQYPYKNDYSYWPGPNSNTFIAYLGRHVPELGLVMPSDAVGKDYLSPGEYFVRAPSGTGYQFSLNGLLGLMIAKKEGLEINILGLTYGFSPSMGLIKLPGWGDIRV